MYNNLHFTVKWTAVSHRTWISESGRKSDFFPVLNPASWWLVSSYSVKVQALTETTNHTQAKETNGFTNIFGICYTITKASLTGILMTAVMTGMLLP